jgi:FemAB-related protein (PEP-CTERM system-associated)
MTALEIHRLTSDDARTEREWDRFVAQAADGTIFHLTAWKHVVETVFGHTAHYLMATDGAQIRGVLPLFEIRGLRSGHVLLSLPYAVYGGVCASDGAVRATLIDESRRLGERLGVRYIELRQLYHPVPELPTRNSFVTFTKRMGSALDLSAIPRKRRRMVRQGRAHALEARRGWAPLPAFYETYAINRRLLGSPPFSQRYFEAIRDRFAQTAELLTVWRNGEVVAGVISFFHRDRVMPYYGASLPHARRLAANDFMYWELMHASSQAGYRIFDFGQSHAGSGGYQFKRLWGFAPEPLAYQYVLIRDRRPPPDVGAPSVRRRPLIEAWKRMPLALTKRIGPTLIRCLPLH